MNTLNIKVLYMMLPLINQKRFAMADLSTVALQITIIADHLVLISLLVDTHNSELVELENMTEDQIKEYNAGWEYNENVNRDWKCW